MTSWDFLNSIINGFPPIAAGLLLSAAIVAVVIFIIGFSRHGADFIKHGFKHEGLESIFEKRFDDLSARMATKEDIAGLRGEIDGLRNEVKAEINRVETSLGSEINRIETSLGSEINRVETELSAIKVNHFGHLKNFLTELTSILLDKNVLNNQDKARLDNQLHGM